MTARRDRDPRKGWRITVDLPILALILGAAAIAFLMLLASIWAAGCAPRPPTAAEQSHGAELGACYALADMLDSGAVYGACRDKVNAKYGVFDAGRWEEP